MRLLLTGSQVDCTIKQSEPRTDSKSETEISPSLNVPTSLLPMDNPRHSEICFAMRWFALAAKILMSLP